MFHTEPITEQLTLGEDIVRSTYACDMNHLSRRVAWMPVDASLKLWILA